MSIGENAVVRALRSYGLSFLAFGVPTGLFAGVVVGLLQRSVSVGLVVGLAAAGFGGGVFALVIGTLEQVFNRGPGRRGPKQDAAVPVRGGPDLARRIQDALLGLHADLEAADIPAGRYAARTPTTWRSFGEHVTVQLTGDPAAPTAHLASRPVIPTTLFDYGRGRRIITHLTEALRS